MTTPRSATSSHARPPLWRNVAALKWLAQIGTVAALVLLFMWLFGNFAAHQEEISTFSFDFLDEPAFFQLGEGYNIQPDSGSQALLVGIVNTLKVALVAIVVATALGIVLGVARLSKNWLVARSASAYVETLRNIPLLVQMVFWLAVLTLLPVLTKGAGPIPGWLLVSNKGIVFAALLPDSGFYQWLLFVVAGAVAARYVRRWRRRLRDTTGQETYELSWGLGTFGAFALVGLLAFPLVSPLQHMWGWLETFFGETFDVGVLQYVVAAAAIAVAILWIRRFLDSLRTPAGLAKVTDDDYYRMIFAGVAALAVAYAGFVFEGVLQVGLDFFRNVFGWLESAYHTTSVGWPIEFSRPSLNIGGDAGQFVTYSSKGVKFTPAFLAVFIGVTLYTAAFIGEAVRAGIQSVPKGQLEAGVAAGFSRTQRLRLVVLPQAFRVMIPPIGNQYLSLAKNTSLGVAVGYLEIVGVGKILASKVGNEASVAMVWMGFYLAMSLILSSSINWYNRRTAIVER